MPWLATKDRDLREQVKPPVKSIDYTKNQFEISEFDITKYAQAIIDENAKIGHKLDATDVVLHWILAVRMTYEDDEAKSEELIGPGF